MKNKLATFLLSALLILQMCLLQTTVNAEGDISPAISVIRSRAEMKKCGVVNTAVTFSPTDFESVIGKVEYITFLSLPDRNYGKLMIGNTAIKEGQTLTRRSLSSVVFEPNKDKTFTASFTFGNPESVSSNYGVCTVFILEKENLSPSALECPFDTGKNISYKGFLKASDPENDDISFSITSAPEHGTLQMSDSKSGFFMYTPKKDFTGRDTFRFRVTDKFGNRSEVCRVIIHINETENNTVFSDMTNHWAHNSAQKICNDRVLSAKNIDGKTVFSPDETVTRGDLLAVAMIGAGLEDKVEMVYSTPFLDDAEIPFNIKSYATAAYKLGIIKGYPAENGVCFGTDAPISRRDAATVLSRIIAVRFSKGASSSDIPVLSEGSLSELNILVGVGGGEMSPDTPVTRAQLAQIYCNLKELCQ